MHVQQQREAAAARGRAAARVRAGDAAAAARGHDAAAAEDAMELDLRRCQEEDATSRARRGEEDATSRENEPRGMSGACE